MPPAGFFCLGIGRNGIGTMGRRKAFTPEQELAVCEMYERVERAVSVAEAFCVNAQTIYRVLEKHGIPRTHRHPESRKEQRKEQRRKRKLEQQNSVIEWTDEVVDDVVRLYESGLSCSKIGDRYHCSWMTIERRLKERSVKLRGKGSSTDALIPQIMELHKQGLSDYEIASELGIGRYAVGYRLQKAGIHRGKGFVSPRESVCERCGKTFVATKKNQIYCSKTCRDAVCSMRRNDAKRVGVDEVETITLREVWERDHGRCYLCGRKTDWSDYRTVNGWRVTGPRYPSRDHVIALSNGGTHTRDNIRLACFECNTNKNNHGQLRLAV